MGPLHSDRQYDISASKEGFVLSPVEGTQGDFKAFALAGVTFTVRLGVHVESIARSLWNRFITAILPSCVPQIKSEDGLPLAGVLLSLSGAQFRSNLLTQDTGLLTFNNLVGVH